MTLTEKERQKYSRIEDGSAYRNAANGYPVEFAIDLAPDGTMRVKP